MHPHTSLTRLPTSGMPQLPVTSTVVGSALPGTGEPFSLRLKGWRNSGRNGSSPPPLCPLPEAPQLGGRGPGHTRWQGARASPDPLEGLKQEAHEAGGVRRCQEHISVWQPLRPDQGLS